MCVCVCVCVCVCIYFFLLVFLFLAFLVCGLGQFPDHQRPVEQAFHDVGRIPSVQIVNDVHIESKIEKPGFAKVVMGVHQAPTPREAIRRKNHRPFDCQTIAGLLVVLRAVFLVLLDLCPKIAGQDGMAQEIQQVANRHGHQRVRRFEIQGPAVVFVNHLVHQDCWHVLIEGVAPPAVVEKFVGQRGVPSQADGGPGQRQHFD